VWSFGEGDIPSNAKVEKFKDARGNKEYEELVITKAQEENSGSYLCYTFDNVHITVKGLLFYYEIIELSGDLLIQ